MRTLIKFLLVILALSVLADHAEAQRRGGGRARGGGGGFRGGGGFSRGGGFARGGSRMNVTSRVNRPSQLPARANIDRNIGSVGNIDRNYNRDYNYARVDRNWDVDVDHDWDWDDRYDGCCYHPVARTAAVAATAAAYNNSYYSLPSTTCEPTIVNGVTYYYNCEGSSYQPVFNGTSTQYIVTNPPR